MNFHPSKKIVYGGIVVFCFMVAVFIHLSITGIIDNLSRHNSNSIEQLKTDAQHKADSLQVVIGTEKLMQQLTADSLQRRVELVARKASTDKQIIISRYETAFKKIMALSDDSICQLDSSYSTKYDSLFARYGYRR